MSVFFGCPRTLAHRPEDVVTSLAKLGLFLGTCRLKMCLDQTSERSLARLLTLANAASTSIARPPRSGRDYVWTFSSIASGRNGAVAVLKRHFINTMSTTVARESTVNQLHLCSQSELHDVQDQYGKNEGTNRFDCAFVFFFFAKRFEEILRTLRHLPYDA